MGSITRSLANNLTTSQGVDTNKFRNLVINGDMYIAQRSTSVSSITGSGFNTVDRMRTRCNIGTWTQSQSTDVPSGQGFVKSLKMDCTTADASPPAANTLSIQHIIEGQNLQYLKKGTSSAESLTMSFWVKSSKTGTYIAELFDNDNQRQISKSYTIDSADTWEKKTITYEGDTSGAYGNDSGASLYIEFWLAAGSNYTSGTLSTTWTANTNANRVVGNVNLADNTSNDWYITGVQLEAGTSASEFEFLPVDVSFLRCQRYYYVHATNSHIIGTMWWYNGSINSTTCHFPTEMRTAPSLSTTSGTGFYRVFTGGSATDFDSFTGIEDESPHAAAVDSGLSGTAHNVGRVKCNDGGEIIFIAELG